MQSKVASSPLKMLMLFVTFERCSALVHCVVQVTIFVEGTIFGDNADYLLQCDYIYVETVEMQVDSFMDSIFLRKPRHKAYNSCTLF